MAKSLIYAVGARATQACSTFNLCAGLQVGIEGNVHALQAMDIEARTPSAPPSCPPPPEPPDKPPDSSTESSSEDEEQALQTQPFDATVQSQGASKNTDSTQSEFMDPHCTTLIDVTNGFNELYCKSMLWTVRHLWPEQIRFTFNCYKHSAQLIVLSPDG